MAKPKAKPQTLELPRPDAASMNPERISYRIWLTSSNDCTPEGRGSDWYPMLDYDSSAKPGKTGGKRGADVKSGRRPYKPDWEHALAMRRPRPVAGPDADGPSCPAAG
jgi:hypothetical protein